MLLIFRYEGEYVNGRHQGEGFMHYPDGSTYDGHWEDGDKSGIGIYTYANGDTYEGEWKDDQKHGKGIYTYKSSGTQFKGKCIYLSIMKPQGYSQIYALMELKLQ